MSQILKKNYETGYQVGNKNFKIHLDGSNMLEYWTNKTDISPWKELFYFSDDADLTDIRYDKWKFVFMEQ
ncbi:MAG: hypothetical protein ACRC2J_09565 [Microcoleaceae cyanobacterium]